MIRKINVGQCFILLRSYCLYTIIEEKVKNRKQEVVVLEEKGFSIKKHKRSEEIIV